MQQNNSFFQDPLPRLLHFLQSSPTPFHALHQVTQELKKQGYQALDEREAWALKSGGKYWVARNQSSLIAFQLADADFQKNPLHLIGAHTDSPCLKLKPHPLTETRQYRQCGVEVYGSPILSTWFDRDLSLAGRIHFQNSPGKLESLLIDFEKPLAVIPNLAIHLDRNANENRSIQKQKELPPLIALSKFGIETKGFEKILLEECHRLHPTRKIGKILSFELSFYDSQKPGLTGLNSEFISASRLDNLLSCWIATQALLSAQPKQNCLIALHDHEEIGSVSHHGADGNFLKSVLERIYPSPELLARASADSLLISCDNAHALHPNFIERYEPQHAPLLDDGPAVKWNANQRYATSSESAAIFAQYAQTAQVPLQSYAVRTDMACGSTIGPLSAAQLGIKTVDVGIPTLAMHSIRELGAWGDVERLLKIFKVFFGN